MADMPDSTVESAPAGGADQLTRGQAARRQRVIRAALDLAAEGGYDAVQMRDVAARGQVALGTIYRYFTSKDHLLAAVQVQWITDLESRIRLRPPKGETTADRMVDILRRATRAMEKEPDLSAAVVTALASPDPAVAGCKDEMDQVMGRIQAMAFPADFDPGVQNRVMRALGFVWFSSLLAWVNGWEGIDASGDELISAAHLMLDQFG
jgi:TetR/AcrR family transcriptional regulator, cholesterol catabolism regulator